MCSGTTCVVVKVEVRRIVVLMVVCTEMQRDSGTMVGWPGPWHLAAPAAGCVPLAGGVKVSPHKHGLSPQGQAVRDTFASVPSRGAGRSFSSMALRRLPTHSLHCFGLLYLYIDQTSLQR